MMDEYLARYGWPEGAKLLGYCRAGLTWRVSDRSIPLVTGGKFVSEMTFKFRPDCQGGHVKLPTLDNEQRYAQAYNLAFVGAPSAPASPINPLPVHDMDLANFLLQSISPVQVPPRLAEDVQVFTRAIKDVIAAAHDKIITPDEADAVIGFLAEQFAARRANQALARIGMPGVLT